jgi:hypothetical protein
MMVMASSLSYAGIYGEPLKLKTIYTLTYIVTYSLEFNAGYLIFSWNPDQKQNCRHVTITIPQFYNGKIDHCT